MAVWVCRTGVNGQYADEFLNNNKIYLTRDNLGFDLKKAEKAFIVSQLYENNPSAARQTISNTWSQIDIFVNRMSIGDVVIVPQKSTMLITVALVKSGYEFSERAKFPFSHSRDIKVLAKGVDTSDFPQSIKYSLGAFRTIFSIRQEDEVKRLLSEKGVSFNEV